MVKKKLRDNIKDTFDDSFNDKQAKKIGRNDPCPCGSGKKYKKCCAARETFDFSIPEEFKTGTILDDYMMLIQGISLFAQSIRQFEEDGKELDQTMKDFEQQFKPGEPKGVPDSVYLSWLYQDFRFGQSGKTICERFIESPFTDKFNDPAPVLLKNLSDSYLSFYFLKDIFDDYLLFEEIATGKEWRAHRMNEPYEHKANRSDIWYVRLLGQQDNAVIYTAPYIMPAGDLKSICKGIEAQKNIWLQNHHKTEIGEEGIREAFKASVRGWLILLCFPQQESTPLPAPILANADGDLLEFSTVRFKIINGNKLLDILNNVVDLHYHESAKEWSWVKKSKNKIKLFHDTNAGQIKIEGEFLIAQANSLRRAMRLKEIMQNALGSAIVYEGIETKSAAGIPPPTAEEMKKFAREQEELYADPEVAAALKRKVEEYYHKSWLKQKLPALGYKTPYEAVKTAEGKKQVEKLLADLEKIQQANPLCPGQIDVDDLRKKLKLR